jgi:hypothetical protein
MTVFLGAINSKRGKKTIVKTWTGKSSDDSKARFLEFPSIKEAKKWITKNDKLYNQNAIWNSYTFHEIIK